MFVVLCVVEEVGVKFGYEVGYIICFEDCINDKTRVKYMTDGMFLREFLGELDLLLYVVMMVDEVYECMLYIDVFFGFVKDIVRF